MSAEKTPPSNRAVAKSITGRTRKPLPYREDMERSFETDFSDVQATTGNRRSLSAINAEAAAKGREVSFAADRPDRETVAHELAHVVQNRAGRSSILSDPASPAEREATEIARSVVAGRRVAVSRPAGGVVQRLTDDEIGQFAARVVHLIQQARVYGIINQAMAKETDPSRGVFDLENLLHNSAEWIKNNNCSVVVLTPIHDSQSRKPGDEVGYFDPLVQWPNLGGEYPADPAVVNDPHITYEDPDDLGGLSSNDVLTIINPGEQSDTLLQETIIHEVQHDADQSWPGQRWADPAGEDFSNYQSEFRAYWLEAGGEGSPQDQYGSSVNPAQNTRMVRFLDPASREEIMVSTNFQHERQETIFWQLVDAGYEYVNRAYCQDPAFEAMVDEFVSPIGGNLLNSVRIQTLSDRIDACDEPMAPTDPAVVTMFAAADTLDDLDRDYLQNDELSKAFWNQALVKLSSTVYQMLDYTVWFGTRQPLGDFEVPEGDTSFA